MKKLIIALLITTKALAVSNDMGKSTGEEFRPLTPQQLQERLEIMGEVFTFDSTGEKLLGQQREVRRWHPRGDNKIESNWGHESNLHKPIAIHHVWTVQKDGSLHALIEQFEKTKEVGNDVKFEGLLKKQEFVVKDFAPITWVSLADKDARVVIRFIPLLRPEKEALSFTAFPISGTDVVVTDSEGSVWTEHISFRGTYNGIISHRGAVLFSLYPFKGAKEIGRVEGKQIKLGIAPKRQVTLTSQTDFLPEGVMGKIYGEYRPQWKTAHFGSTQVKCSDQEKEFLKKLD